MHCLHFIIILSIIKISNMFFIHCVCIFYHILLVIAWTKCNKIITSLIAAPSPFLNFICSVAVMSKVAIRLVWILDMFSCMTCWTCKNWGFYCFNFCFWEPTFFTQNGFSCNQPNLFDISCTSENCKGFCLDQAT